MADRRTGLQIGIDQEKAVKEALGVGDKEDTRTYEFKGAVESPVQYSEPIPNVPGTKKKSVYVPKKIRDAKEAAKQAKLDELSQKAAEQKASDPRRLLYKKGPNQYSDKNYYVGDNKKSKEFRPMFASTVGHPRAYFNTLSPQQQSIYNEAFQQHQIEHHEEALFSIKDSHSHAEAEVKRASNVTPIAGYVSRRSGPLQRSSAPEPVNPAKDSTPATPEPAPTVPGTAPSHFTQSQQASYNSAYSAQSQYLQPETAHKLAISAATSVGQTEANRAASARLRDQNIRPMGLHEVVHSPAGSPDTKFSPSEQDYIRINTDVRQANDRYGEHSREQHEQWTREELLRHRNTTPTAPSPAATKPQSAKERVAAQEAAEVATGIPRIAYKGKNHYPPGTKQYTHHEQEMLDRGISPSLLEISRSAAVTNAQRRAQREERKQGMGQDYNNNHIEAQKALREHELAPTPEPTEETMATIDPTAQSQASRTARKAAKGNRQVAAAPSGTIGGATKFKEAPVAQPGPVAPSGDAIDNLIASAKEQVANRRTKTPKTAPKVEAPQAQPETPAAPQPQAPRTGEVPPVSSADIRSKRQRLLGDKEMTSAAADPSKKEDLKAPPGHPSFGEDAARPARKSAAQPVVPAPVASKPVSKPAASTSGIGSAADIKSAIYGASAPKPAGLGSAQDIKSAINRFNPGATSSPSPRMPRTREQETQALRLPTESPKPVEAAPAPENNEVKVHGYISHPGLPEEYTHFSHGDTHYAVPSHHFEKTFPSGGPASSSTVQQFVSRAGGNVVDRPEKLVKTPHYQTFRPEKAKSEPTPALAEAEVTPEERAHAERRAASLPAAQPSQQPPAKRSQVSDLWPGVDIHHVYYEGGQRRVAVTNKATGLSYGLTHNQFEGQMKKPLSSRERGEGFHEWAMTGKNASERAKQFDLSDFEGEKGRKHTPAAEDPVIQQHLALHERESTSSNIPTDYRKVRYGIPNRGSKAHPSVSEPSGPQRQLPSARPSFKPNSVGEAINNRQPSSPQPAAKPRKQANPGGGRLAALGESIVQKAGERFERRAQRPTSSLNRMQPIGLHRLNPQQFGNQGNE